MKKLSCGFTLKELSDRGTADVQAAKDSKTLEEKIANQARINARNRDARKTENFYDRQIELATLREERQGKYSREERMERMAEVRTLHAKEGFTRANLASRFTKEHRHSAILAVFKGIMDKHNVKYCFPSQETICWLLWRYYGINMSRRTLVSDLQDLSDSGAIKRTRRHIRGGGRIILHSTLYHMTQKGNRLLKMFQKLFKFIRKTAAQNIAQHTSYYSNKERLCGANAPVGTAKRCPDGQTLEFAT